MQHNYFAQLKSTVVKTLGFEQLHFKRREKLLALLSGGGIEIGALHQPVEAPHLDIEYVDRLTNQELRSHYPELLKQKLVVPDIIDDAETLATIPDDSYDFVIANHVIEHLRNPIGALLTWQRVLKPGGRLFLAAPDKRKTLDKDRPLTSIQHLMEDYNELSDERDFEAFKEFALHWTCRAFQQRPESEYEQVAQELFDQKYSIHYHVWEYKSFCDLLSYLAKHFDTWSFRILKKARTLRNEFVFVLEKN